MPEIITLSSSPPASPAKSEASPGAAPAVKALTRVAFGSDDFDDTGDIACSPERPLKRRKTISPASIAEDGGRTKPTKKVEIAFDLSSDVELPALPSSKKQKDQKHDDLSIQVDQIDDIVFSSSAPGRITGTSKTAAITADTFDLSSDSLPDDPFEGLLTASQPANVGPRRSAFTEKTANLLAGLSEGSPKKPKPKSGDRSKTISVKLGQARRDEPDDIVVSSPPKPAARKGKAAAAQDAAKQSDAAAKRAQKAADKEAEKDRKQAERAQKACEKQKAADIAEVNKSKTNKKDAVVEMSVEMSGDFQDTSVGNQVEAHLAKVGVSMSYFEEEINLQTSAVRYQDLGCVVRWKRKSKSVWDEDAGEWFPAPERVTSERHALVYLKAIEFAMIAAGYSGEDRPLLPSASGMKENFDLHVATLRSRYKDFTPIYLIEGLYAWLKKNHNARNREYTAAVRAQQAVEEVADAAGSSSQAKVRKRKKPPAVDLSFITEDITEDLLLHLQVAHQPIFIQHTTSATMTAEQIFTFTQQLSTRPYRRIELDHNLKAATFCMATGQVRTGDDARDTYIKMLQEVQRVTPAMAYGIENSYPSIRKLVNGFRQEGNLMLEDVRKSANKDGAWTDRRLGPMVSKRLYKVFMGRDPAAMDGMS